MVFTTHSVALTGRNSRNLNYWDILPQPVSAFMDELFIFSIQNKKYCRHWGLSLPKFYLPAPPPIILK